MMMPLSQLHVVLKNMMASGRLSGKKSSRRCKDGAKAWAGIFQTLEQRCLLSATAVLVEDIQPGGGLHNGTESSAPGAAVDVSGTTYFVANDGINGAELWRISAGGTAQLVEDSIPGGGIRPGAAGANISQLTNVSGVLYFSADDGAHGQELWRIQGNGTAVMVDGAVSGEGIRALPQQVYSYGPGGGGGFNTGYYINQPGGSLPGNLTNVNGTLYFSADDGLSGRELWKINSAGTGVLVDDGIAGDGINPVAETQYPVHPIGSPQLVPGSSNPQELTVVGSTLFFRANNGTNGAELWRINSAGVAEMIDDSAGTGDPGFAGNVFASGPTHFTSVSGTLYFVATDEVNGYELWRVGATGNAELVEDAVPGGGINVTGAGSYPTSLFNFQGTLYFAALNDQTGMELWRINSGGTAELVNDIATGNEINPSTGSSSPGGFAAVGTSLYFIANDGSRGVELWRIATPGGQAAIVEDSIPGGGIAAGAAGASVESLINVAGVLYFLANDGTNGKELWRVNSAGTAEMVEDAVAGGGIRPGNLSAYPGELTTSGGVLFFRAIDPANGSELWRVNSAGIAEPVENSLPGGGIGIGTASSVPSFLRDINGTLFFSADDGIDGVELWRVTGNGQASLIGKDGSSGGINSRGIGSHPQEMINIGGTVYFTARSALHGFELWRIGASGIAEIVEDVVPGGGIAPGNSDSNARSLTNVNGRLYFIANDTVNGTELWRINAAGHAEMVEDGVVGGGINPGNAGSDPVALTVMDSTLFFIASDGSSGEELWRVNSAGTAELVDNNTPDGGIASGTADSDVRYLTSVSGSLYFTANDGTNGQELWKVGPTGIATLIEDAIPGGGIAPGSSGGSVAALTNVNGVLYFVANDAVNGSELWKVVSGTTAVMVEDSVAGGGIAPGNGNSFPYQLTNLNGTLYFSATDVLNGHELWRINAGGTAEMVEDAIPGGGIGDGGNNALISSLTHISGRIYFSANDGIHGQELWRINDSGIAEMVEDAIPGGGINPVSYSGYVYGQGYVTDYPGSSHPIRLTNVNGTLYFSAMDGVNGQELWRVNSLGIAELVEDSVPGGGLRAGPFGGSPDLLYNAEGVLYFSAQGDAVAGGGTSGRELWRVNSAGIAELVNAPGSQTGINPGSQSSNPGLILGVGSAVYFAADDGISGRELWKTTTTDVVQGTPQSDLITITYTTAGWQVTMKTGNAPLVSFPLFPLTLTLNVLASGGEDTIRVVGTTGEDRFIVTGGGLTVNNARISLFDHESVSLVGLQGSDAYVFDADTAGGRHLIEDISGAADTLDFSATDSAGITFNLGSVAEQQLPGTLRLRLASSSAIENLRGSNLSDLLIGNSLGNILTGNGGSDTLNGYFGSDTLLGGTGDDAYFFGFVSAGALLENDIVTEQAGAGSDTLNFRGVTSDVTVSLGSSAAQTVHAGRNITLNSSSTFEHVVGGPGADRITGNAVGNSLSGGGGNDTLNGFWGSDTLIGGLGDDTYVFGATSGNETDRVSENPNEGTDTLNFAALAIPLTLNMSISVPQSVHTERTLILNSAGSVENAVGTSASDQMIGNAAANGLDGRGGSDTLNGFTGSDRLTGGTGDDVFVFGVVAPGETDVLTEGPGGGNDTLNFAGLTTAVTLNLGSTLPQQVHLGRVIQLSHAEAFENAVGGSANDSLRGNGLANRLDGNGGDDVLVGGAGNDTLIGSSGRDVIVGGTGIDSIVAGSGEDLLIAGRIFHNGNADDADFVSALKVLWNQSLPVAVRIATVTALVSSTAAIQPDLQADQIQSAGDGPLDLLFASLGDVISKDAADFLSII